MPEPSAKDDATIFGLPIRPADRRQWLPSSQYLTTRGYQLQTLWQRAAERMQLLGRARKDLGSDGAPCSGRGLVTADDPMGHIQWA